jgi:hypothetical protein
MMNLEQAKTATLDQLNEELGAAGEYSLHTSRLEALEAYYDLHGRYRIVNANSLEVLSAYYRTYLEALQACVEIESHETEPECRIEYLQEGEWVHASP